MSGLPHIATVNESLSTPASIVAMEAREGRIGNAFACERCRKHKVRCVPSGTAGICQRCEKARVECIEHVARRRPAKPRTMVQTPNRVAEMEKKMEKLSAIVTATPVPNSAPQPALPSVSTVPSQGSETAQRTPTPTSTANIPPPVANPHMLPNPGSTPESALSFWESINDSISGLGQLDPVIRTISVIHMQMLLENYRAMSDFFPFVVLPKDYFCSDLLQQRPILMFAVLTAGSYDSALLQLTLSREFRKLIVVKIVKGERSLDLLQGLLVFIAWQHHYMDAQAVSIRVLLQLCIGIAGDLGLDNITPSPRSPLLRDDGQERESKRAYLGCYYLALNLSMMNSSRSMSYSNVFRTYASELASAWEHRSDIILPDLIDTCQFMEDVEETFRNQSLQAYVVKAQLGRLSERWESMRHVSNGRANDYSKSANLTMEIPSLILAETLQLLQLSARVHLFKTIASLELADLSNTPWASGFQLSQRMSLLRSIEQFLDTSLQISSAHYEQLSIVDYLSLINSLTMLCKLALHATPMAGWDVTELQIVKTFDYFRDNLCSIMPQPRDTASAKPQDGNGEDVFERFRRITALMKSALKTSPARASPNGSTFELATGQGRTVSLLQDLPPLMLNGNASGHVREETLPAPWKKIQSPRLIDMSTDEFSAKFLLGTV